MAKKEKEKDVRYVVLNNLEVEVFSSDDLKEALETIQEMQKDKKEPNPKIYLRDDKDETMILWKKNTFERNYIQQSVKYFLHDKEPYLIVYLEDGTEAFQTNNLRLAEQYISKALSSKNPVLYLRDDNEETAYSWTKQRNNKNYIMQSIEYPLQDVVDVPKEQ